MPSQSSETAQIEQPASARSAERSAARDRDLRLALPKGRMEHAVLRLLADAGVEVAQGARAYRPVISLANVSAKILKPQNVVEMLHFGARDVGFAGADWVAELEANVVELLDTGLDPVRIVAAAPADALDGACALASSPVVIATEYERLTKKWVKSNGLDAIIVKTFGATEVFPPEDADCIVDNAATGSTLRANGLVEFAELMRSSTRLYASQNAMIDPEKHERIEALTTLLRSVLEARTRAIVEVNVAADKLDALVAALPAMREPTIAPLHGSAGYAVRVAAPRKELATLIPRIKAHGGTDIIVTTPGQIVP